VFTGGSGAGGPSPTRNPVPLRRLERRITAPLPIDVENALQTPRPAHGLLVLFCCFSSPSGRGRPLLQQKVLGMPEETIHEEFIRSIRGLEYSVTMDMDRIQADQ